MVSSLALMWKSRSFARSARHENDGLRIFFFCSPILKVYNTVRRGDSMTHPLPALVDDRSTLLHQISELGDFSRVPSPVRPGAVAVPVAIAPNPMTPDTALISTHSES